MPPPVIIPVSSSELNVTWSKPRPDQARGEVIRYTLWHYQATDLEKLPFAPPYSWVVSFSVMLCPKITRFRMLSTSGQLSLLTEGGIETGFSIQVTLLNHLCSEPNPCFFKLTKCLWYIVSCWTELFHQKPFLSSIHLYRYSTVNLASVPCFTWWKICPHLQTKNSE